MMLVYTTLAIKNPNVKCIRKARLECRAWFIFIIISIVYAITFSNRTF